MNNNTNNIRPSCEADDSHYCLSVHDLRELLARLSDGFEFPRQMLKQRYGVDGTSSLRRRVVETSGLANHDGVKLKPGSRRLGWFPPPTRRAIEQNGVVDFFDVRSSQLLQFALAFG